MNRDRTSDDKSTESTEANSGINNKTGLHAGAACVDITPPLGSLINGDFVSHYAQHIHDQLYVKALVLSSDSGDNDQTTMIAIVLLDLCVLSTTFVKVIKQLVQEQLGIPVTHQLIATTHTHAAPAVEAVYLCGMDLVYREKLPGLIVAAVKKAMDGLKPAKIGMGQVEANEHVRCRRYFMKVGASIKNPINDLPEAVKTNPFGYEDQIERPVSGTDPMLSFVGIKGLDDSWIAVLANYSLHYVGDWPNGQITADYYGYFAKYIKDGLQAGDEFVTLMSNGTSGDINIWDFIQEASGKSNYPKGDFEKSDFIGHDLADKVLIAIRDLHWQHNSTLAIAFEELSLLLRKPDAAALAIAREKIAKGDFENFVLNETGMGLIYAREQLFLNELPDEIAFPLQVIKIGNIFIGGLGGEIFAETGLWLKRQVLNASSALDASDGAKASLAYFTIGLANGNCGYVPTKQSFDLGGYETWRSRTSKLQPEAEELIKTNQWRLIRELIQKDFPA